MKSISASDANRHFSAVLRDVSFGEEVVVISRGKAVAKIVGIEHGDRAMHSAKTALLERLRTQPVAGKRDWKRADLYE